MAAFLVRMAVALFIELSILSDDVEYCGIGSALSEG